MNRISAFVLQGEGKQRQGDSVYIYVDGRTLSLLEQVEADVSEGSKHWRESGEFRANLFRLAVEEAAEALRLLP